MAGFIEARTLHEYPSGGYRWFLILLAMMGGFVTAFPFQLGPLVPLFLPYLHMSRLAFGYFTTATVLLTAVAALVGAPLADKYGRATIIDLGLAAMLVVHFLNLLIPPNGIWSFIVLRGLMNMLGGFMAGGALAIMRDYSPRVSRGLSLGIFVFAAVIFVWFSNFIAGRTLPIYHTWQSQIIIVGIIGVALYIPVFLWLKDLSPALRQQVVETEAAGQKAARESAPVEQAAPPTGIAAYMAVLSHVQIPLQVIAITAELTTYFVFSTFGALMFTDAFKYSPADAASMTAYFFLLNPTFVLIGGAISDVVRARRTVSVIGGILAAITLGWWLTGFGHVSPESTRIAVSLIGIFSGIAYGAWGPLFSETVEDIEPALQATGWGFFNFSIQAWIAISATLTLAVAVRWGWAAWIKVCLAALILHVVLITITGLMRERTSEAVLEAERRGA